MNSFLFIINPISGGLKKDRIVKAIERAFDSTSVSWSIVFTSYAGHATTLAKEAETDAVVAVGGDGTVCEVARGLIGTEIVLGIIPCGSGNGLALHLGISRDPNKAIRALLHGNSVKMDCGIIDNDLFFCTAGLGLDAEVALRFASSSVRGLRTYIYQSWNAWKSYKPDNYHIRIDGKEIVTQAFFVTVGNANQWGNNARICPQASVLDGQLDVVIVRPFGLIEIPRLVFKLFTGRAYTSRKVLMYRGCNISISRTQIGPAQYDGNPCMKGENIAINIVPKALNIIIQSDKSCI